MCLIVLFSDHTLTSILPWRWYGQACLKFIGIFLLTKMKSSALNILCRLKHPSPNCKCSWHLSYQATWTNFDNISLLTRISLLLTKGYHLISDLQTMLFSCTFPEHFSELLLSPVNLWRGKCWLKIHPWYFPINIYIIKYWSRLWTLKYSNWIFIQLKPHII